MKKLLIIVMIVLVTALTFVTVGRGIKIGGFSILSIFDIKEESAQLDKTVEQATKLASTDFPKAVSTVNENVKKLQTQKQSYEDMVTVSTDSQVQLASQYEKYKVEVLWTKIGKHATSEGVVMKMDITKGASNTSDTYNLNFTATGSYIAITDFITDIEDDSSLGFKIEEFKMIPSTSDANQLTATFICKDIAIEGISGTSPQTPQTNANDANNTNSTNNTNNTNNTTNSAATNTASNTATNNTATNNTTTNTTNTASNTNTVQ